MGDRKFGPHFVTAKTLIGNIRLTTFFVGEHEVRIVDPDLVEFIDARGCQVERPDPFAPGRSRVVIRGKR